jgi:hypothetical protein
VTVPTSALGTASAVGSTVVVPLLDDVPLPSEVTPGWVALAVILTLIAVTVLLWRSMRKQLGRIRFDEEPDGDAGQPGAEDPDRP